MIVVLAILIFLVKVLAGFALAHLIWDSTEVKALLLKFFIGVGLGTGLSSLLYFLSFWCRFPPVVYPYVEHLLLILLVWRIRKPITKIKIAFTRAGLAWGGLIVLAVALCVTQYLVRAAQVPHGLQDAWGIWNVSARFIYGAGDRWLSIIPQSAWFHSDYPLLVSLNIADTWSLMASTTTRVPIIFGLVYLLGLIGLLGSSLAFAKDNHQGALGAIVFASVPVVASLAANQYADVQLSYFFLASGMLFYSYTFTHQPRLLILAGLFVGLAGWTKNEGLAFIVIAAALCAFLSLREKKNLLKYFLVGLALPLLVILLFKTITPPNDLFVDKAASFRQLFDLSRYLTIITRSSQTLFSFGNWPISFFIIFLVYVLLNVARPQSAGKLWILPVLLLAQFASYFFIYLFTPADILVHINSSIERLFFHLFPLTLCFALILLPSPRHWSSHATDH
jgi:hypothetical protein